MSEIDSKLNMLRLLNKDLECNYSEQKQKEVLELYAWLEREAKDGARAKFAKYLRFENWH